VYRIREVDGHDDEIADTLIDLHRLTFFDGAAIPEFEMVGAASFPIRLTTWSQPTTSSGHVIGCTSRNIRGPGQTRCIGANRSDAV
jgi:hypothetical protein